MVVFILCFTDIPSFSLVCESSMISPIHTATNWLDFRASVQKTTTFESHQKIRRWTGVEICCSGNGFIWSTHIVKVKRFQWALSSRKIGCRWFDLPRIQILLVQWSFYNHCYHSEYFWSWKTQWVDDSHHQSKYLLFCSKVEFVEPRDLVLNFWKKVIFSW